MTVKRFELAVESLLEEKGLCSDKYIESFENGFRVSDFIVKPAEEEKVTLLYGDGKPYGIVTVSTAYALIGDSLDNMKEVN